MKLRAGWSASCCCPPPTSFPRSLPIALDDSSVWILNNPHRHVSFCVASPLQFEGVVYFLFGSLSYLTLPSDSLRMYLYSKLPPAGKLTVTNQRLLSLVYLEALNAIALLVLQLPSCGILPTMKTFSPNAVVAISLKRTLVRVGVAEQVGVGGVGREKVLVAVAQGPLAELREQLDGSLALHE